MDERRSRVYRTDLNVPGSTLRAAVVIVVITFAGLSPLQRLRAQALPPSLSNLEYNGNLDVTPTQLSPRAELGDSNKYPRTYWLEGALLAGIPLSLLGAALGGGFCNDADSPGGGNEPCWDDALLGFATGLGVGASLGGLIGGLIKKPEKTEGRDRE
jgi:hypothetical protein